jgi:ammonia channel protein AmtB
VMTKSGHSVSNYSLPCVMYFANTPPTVVRFRYEGYIIFSIVMSGLVYPVAAHWGWSAGGWLATTYVDLCIFYTC